MFTSRQSRHDGVSCDSCLKGNFRGRRYKCLVCYDYDLCASCYESGVTTTRHLNTHAMQCILTRSDHDLFYGGESSSATNGHHSYTCPFCAKLGFTETSLVEHVTAQHADATNEVVCPICASLPGGDPNHVTDDFTAHLTLEHRSGPRDLISFLDSPSANSSGTVNMTRAMAGNGGVRRVPHVGRGRGHIGSSARSRGTADVHNPNQPSNPSVGGGVALSSTLAGSGGTGSSRANDSVDPIAELLSQLSGVRRAAHARINPSSSSLGGGTAGAASLHSSSSQQQSSSQLQHQLQIQLQMERQQAQRLQEQLPPSSRGATAAPRTRSGFPNVTVPGGVSGLPTSTLGGALGGGSQHHHHHHGAAGGSAASAAAAATLGLSGVLGTDLLPTAGANAASTSAAGGAATAASVGSRRQFLLRQYSDEELSSSSDGAVGGVGEGDLVDFGLSDGRPRESGRSVHRRAVRASRSQFVQDLVLSSLMMKTNLKLDSSSSDDDEEEERNRDDSNTAW